MALTDNLRAAYKLDDTSDYSGNGYNLTNTGTVTFATGVIGNAAIFGASNTTKKLDIASALGVASGDDISISYFSRDADNLSASQCVELAYNSGGKRIQIFRDAQNQRWALYVNAATGFSSAGDGLSNNTWRHLCMVFTGGTATLYINTVSKVTNTPGAATTSSDHFSLQNSFVDTGFRSGDIDLLYVWNRALSGAEISTLYNSGNGFEVTLGSANLGLLRAG